MKKTIETIFIAYVSVFVLGEGDQKNMGIVFLTIAGLIVAAYSLLRIII